MRGMGGGNGIMQKAVMAMLSGQTPETFLQNLAKTDARFQGLDLTNLENTAHQLCHDRGIDENQLAAQVKNQVQDLI